MEKDCASVWKKAVGSREIEEPTPPVGTLKIGGLLDTKGALSETKII